MIRVIRRERVLVCRGNYARSGIIDRRHLIEWNVTIPFELSGSAVQRKIAVEIAANRHSSRCLVSDIARAVGIDKILRRSPKAAQSGAELVPILRFIDVEERKTEAIRRAPSHAVALALLLQHDGAMARDPDVEFHRLAPAYTHKLAIALRLLRLPLKSVTPGSVVQLFHIQVDNIGLQISNSPGDLLVMTGNDAG